MFVYIDLVCIETIYFYHKVDYKHKTRMECWFNDKTLHFLPGENLNFGIRICVWMHVVMEKKSVDEIKANLSFIC